MSAGIDVFLSYARTDQVLARKLVDTLRNAGLAVWWDFDIPDGARFREDTLDALEQAGSVVVLWSDASVASPWVAQEALIGLDRHVLVPLLVGSPSIPPGLGAVQAMRVPDAGDQQTLFFDRFATALNHILEDRRTTARMRRGLTIDVKRYNRLTLARLLACSLLLSALSSALVWLAAYGSGDSDNVTAGAGLALLGFFFVGRLLVGAPPSKVFVTPERFCSGRMLAVVLVAALVLGLAAAVYPDAVRGSAGAGTAAVPGVRGGLMYVARSLPTACFAGLLSIPLVRLAARLVERHRGANHGRPDVASLGVPIRRLGTPPLLLLGLLSWASILGAAAFTPDVSRLDARAFAAGRQFNDCGDGGWCPTMIIVPAGTGVIGSPAGEIGHSPEEGPVHEIAVPSFAIGKYEITIGQWRACVAQGGCTHDRPWTSQDRDHWARLTLPVDGLTWARAQQYVQWLSRRTGQRYRLPSEAEWEYAARGGTRTVWPWGDDPRHACAFSNTGDDVRMQSAAAEQRPPNLCNDGVGFETTRVGHYRPNTFGLFDMLGNAQEWVADCWNPSHAGAPPGTAPRMTGDCTRHVVKGGDYDRTPLPHMRSASRSGHPDNSIFFNASSGLRVVRELR